MRLTRVYHAGQLANQVQLSATASHHLAKVLRLSVGDACLVFDGKGHEARYRIAKLHRSALSLTKIEDVVNQTESVIQLHLCQAIAKGDKMDWILQKAVELGVTQVTPMITEHSDVRLTAERLAKKCQHWRAVMVSACQQSGRAVLPELVMPGITFDELVKQTFPVAEKCLFSPRSTDLLREGSPQASYLLAIGPEGGFSEHEVTTALAEGFKAYSLGRRVLRTETAAVAAVANLQCLFDQ